MEFYKLYCVLHRHTGWYDFMIKIDRLCRPDYYEQRRKNAERTLKRFMFGMTAINGAINGANKGNEVV